MFTSHNELELSCMYSYPEPLVVVCAAKGYDPTTEFSNANVECVGLARGKWFPYDNRKPIVRPAHTTLPPRVTQRGSRTGGQPKPTESRRAKHCNRVHSLIGKTSRRHPRPTTEHREEGTGCKRSSIFSPGLHLFIHFLSYKTTHHPPPPTSTLLSGWGFFSRRSLRMSLLQRAYTGVLEQ